MDLEATQESALRMKALFFHRSEMDRLAPGPNRKIYQLLHTASAPNRSGWYFNNLIMRHLLSAERLSMMSIGTSSNEALHHEINNWFRETQKLHKATLTLKLEIMQLAKVLTHKVVFVASGLVFVVSGSEMLPSP